MDTEVESVCCKEFQRCRFLRAKISESDEDTDVCVVEHPSFAAHMDSGALETFFRIPKVNWKRQPKPAGDERTSDCKVGLARIILIFEYSFGKLVFEA